MNEKALKAVRAWWSKLTLPQAVCFVAGLGALYLMRDSLPNDADGWKQWAHIAGYVLAGLASAGSLVNGKDSERPSEPPEET